MDWIFVDDKMPDDGQFVLAKCGENSPIGIARFIDGEWETGTNGKRVVYNKTNKYYTSASVVYWMPLPELPNEIL